MNCIWWEDSKKVWHLGSEVIFQDLGGWWVWLVVGGVARGRFLTTWPQVPYLFGILSPNAIHFCRKKNFFSTQEEFFFSDLLGKVRKVNCSWEGVNCMVWNFFLVKVVCICLKYQNPNRQSDHSTFTIYHNILPLGLLKMFIQPLSKSLF